MSNHVKDLTGQRFGHLVALEPTGKRRGRKVVWRARCDCGNEIEATGYNLTREGGTRSCGCNRAPRGRITTKGEKP